MSWGWSTAALAWAAAAGVLLRERIVLGLPALVSLAGLAGLTAWIALSLAWTMSVPLTALEVERSLVPLAGLAAALALSRRAAHGLPFGVAAAAAIVAAWNLLAGGDAPLGYANALALLCVIGVLLILGLAAEVPDRRGLLVALPLAALLLVTLGRTESRAAWIALAAGAAATAALRLRRPGILLAAVVVAGAVALGATGEFRSEQRQAYWSVAAHESVRSAPLGTGAGTWSRTWLEQRAEPFAARDAHSLYLEALSELGPLGLALVLAALAPPLVAAVRAREAPFVRPVAGAYVAFVLHLGVDWAWELTAVSLAGVLLGGFLLTSGSGARTLAIPRPAALPALAAVGVAALGGLAGNVFTARAGDRLRAGDWTAAASAARRASDLAPWAAEPWRLRGEADLARGDRTGAAASLRRGLERDAGDVELWRALARATSGEELRRARERATQLDPLSG